MTPEPALPPSGSHAVPSLPLTQPGGEGNLLGNTARSIQPGKNLNGWAERNLLLFRVSPRIPD